MLGNHDDREAFFNIFGRRNNCQESANSVQRLSEMRIVLLDTLDPGSGTGVLCADRLTFLERRLGNAGSMVPAGSCITRRSTAAIPFWTRSSC